MTIIGEIMDCDTWQERYFPGLFGKLILWRYVRYLTLTSNPNPNLDHRPMPAAMQAGHCRLELMKVIFQWPSRMYCDRNWSQYYDCRQASKALPSKLDRITMPAAMQAVIMIKTCLGVWVRCQNIMTNLAKLERRYRELLVHTISFWYTISVKSYSCICVSNTG